MMDSLLENTQTTLNQCFRRLDQSSLGMERATKRLSDVSDQTLAILDDLHARITEQVFEGQNMDFLTMQETLNATLQERRKSRDEAKEAKEERKIAKSVIDVKLTDAKKDLEMLMETIHDIENQIQQEQNIPILLKLMSSKF